MEQNEIIEKLRLSGLDTDDTGLENGTFINVAPEYRGNYGFHHATWKTSSAILVKGVYKDYLRVISGASDISESDWDEIAKTLNQIEQTLEKPAKSKLRLVAGKVYVLSAEEGSIPKKRPDDRRDYCIPRPLTNVEYSLPSSKVYDETSMFSSALFGEFFPNTFSPYMESLFEKTPDILNPIFASCDLKTVSPTTIAAYGRIYSNMTALDKMLKMIGTGNSIFRASFSPHLYVMRSEKSARYNKKYFPVELHELTELMDELSRTVAHINMATLTEEKIYEYQVQIFIVYEYLAIKFSDLLAHLLEYFPDIPSVLEAVFKTRNNSIFTKTEELNLAKYFDVQYDTVPVTFAMELKAEPLDTFIAKLPFFKRLGSAGAIKKAIAEVHSLLDIRDSIYITASSYIVNLRKALLQLSEHAMRKSKIRFDDEIFFFEQEEAKKIYYDTLYSESYQSILFRKWQRERFSAQAVPPEIYASDFENAGQITEKMLIKYMDMAEYKVLPLVVKNTEGDVSVDECAESYAGKIIAAARIPLPELPKYAGAAAFILENASPFSFVAEFAVRNGIGLFTGLRYAPILLSGLKVRTDGAKISKIK